MTKHRLVWGYWLPVMVYCTAIFIQSSLPAVEKLFFVRFSDKLYHFFAFAILGALFLRAYARSFPRQHPHRQFLVAAVSVALYGISDEYHQHFVTNRVADTVDALADVFGGVCGVWAYQRLTATYFSGMPYHSRIDKIADFL